MDERRRRYIRKIEGETHFILGDEACAYGALFAGCMFFGAYPITPASEIAETLARELPRAGGYFVQFEDELASISAIIGAAWAGAKAMTATSGPGFSLMQEGIGYGIMTETPCVIVDIQRSGPSTGQATKGAQSDIMQARWGAHGDHNIIAISPASSQEYLDMTIKAFNLAERYRTPVVILGDGDVGHLREKVTFPKVSELEIVQRKQGKKGEPHAGGSLIPPMQQFGRGNFTHVTGSTHKPDGMRDVATQSVHIELVGRLYDKIDKNREEIADYEELGTDDAEVLLLAAGAASRAARGAYYAARDRGLKVGLLRLKTVWPFPDKRVRELGEKVKKILVPEMSLGQLYREVERFVSCPVECVSKVGGVAHTVEEVYEKVEESF